MGDCRYPLGKNAGKQIIVTVNQDLEPIQFLITALHELAHAQIFREYKVTVSAHGKEWKSLFSRILKEMSDLCDNDIDKKTLLALAKNPKSTSFGNQHLQQQLKSENSVFLRDLPNETVFRFDNKTFKKIKFLRTYSICVNLSNKRRYKIHGLAEITDYKQ